MSPKINFLAKAFLPLVLFVALNGCSGNTSKQGDDPAAIPIQVYKSPTCGCCGKWVRHMEQHGFDANIHNIQNLNPIKSRYGIEPKYQSCHTAEADGYVFEGHIPAPVVHHFLNTKPSEAIGLAVPGMPIGSPGMEMENRFDNYDVIMLKKDGSTTLFATVTGENQIAFVDTAGSKKGMENEAFDK